jgi:hypothetical protein
MMTITRVRLALDACLDQVVGLRRTRDEGEVHQRRSIHLAARSFRGLMRDVRGVRFNGGDHWERINR